MHNSKGIQKSSRYKSVFDQLKPNISHSAENYRSRKMIWDIDYFTFLFLVRGKCYYCGRDGDSHLRNLRYCGIDRVDNNKDYTMDNVVSCCKKM